MWFSVACEIVMPDGASELRTWVVFGRDADTVYRELRAQAEAKFPRAQRIRIVVGEIPEQALAMIRNGVAGVLR